MLRCWFLVLWGRGMELLQEIEKLKSLEQCSAIKFQCGEIILRQGEPVKDIYYLMEGTCYRSAITKQGEEYFYWIRGSENAIDSLLGVFSLYGNGYSGSSVTAKTDCECLRIPGDVFLEFADTSPALLRKLLERSLRQYGDLDRLFHSYKEGKAAEQVASVLLEGCEYRKGQWELPGMYSYDFISRKTALHRVTVARILCYLKEQGIIGREGRRIIVFDQEELQKIADGKPVKYYKKQ